MSYILKGKLESVKYDFVGKIEEIKIVPCGEYTLRKDDKKYCILMQQTDSKDRPVEDAKLLEYKNAVTINMNVDKCMSFSCRKTWIISLSLGKEVLLAFDDATPDDDAARKDAVEGKLFSIKSDQQCAGKEIMLFFKILKNVEVFA